MQKKGGFTQHHFSLKRYNHSKRLLLESGAGFTLIEALITISIFGIAAVVLGSALVNIRLNRANRSDAASGFLAQSEIEAVRSLPFGEITNQTNGSFRNVLFQQGTWAVASHAFAPSGNQVIELTGSGTGDISGLAIVPAGSGITDGSIVAYMNVRNESPSNWQAGFLFRAKDRENSYRVWYSSSQIKVQKVVAGTVTDIYSRNQAFLKNTWYKLEIVLATSSINVKLNDIPLTGMPITDLTFTKGAVALFGSNGASLDVDSLSVVQGANTLSWNFDSGETLGNLPIGWERFGVYDLPQGTAVLSITDAEVGFTDIKKITVQVGYTIDSGTRTQTIETLISQGGIAQ
ncbi:MAG: type II secretion system protein [Patescibacteria group bacterium]